MIHRRLWKIGLKDFFCSIFFKQKLRDYLEFLLFFLILQNVCKTAEWFDRLWYWGIYISGYY